MNAISVAMNAAGLTIMNAFHVIIIMMDIYYKKVHINVLLNVKHIGIQI